MDKNFSSKLIILKIIWGIFAVFITFGILSVMVGGTQFYFFKNGIGVAITFFTIYILFTIILGIKQSKSWFFFIPLIIGMIILAPFLLIFYLNRFPYV